VALLDRDHEAAKALIDAICTAWNDQTSSDTPLRSYRQGSWRWEGYEREVEGQWWLGVGWSELKGTTVADIWVSKPGTGSFWQKARTPEQLSRLMEQLADWWWWQ